MDIGHFKDQHVQILSRIAALRDYSRQGVRENAANIARLVKSLSSVITAHLAVEDRILYPTLQQGSDTQLAEMGRRYQEEMKGIATAYIAFSRRWSLAKQVADEPEAFRADANTVLKRVHQRMQQENTEFYPAIEAV